jgi:CspA family cold shock protein
MIEYGGPVSEPRDVHKGVVEAWHDEDGWGVIRVAGQPGQVWAHFSAIDAPGFRALTEGDEVELRAEQAEQDGYSRRATWIRRR